jgi:hypothetical protein
MASAPAPIAAAWSMTNRFLVWEIIEAVIEMENWQKYQPETKEP